MDHTKVRRLLIRLALGLVILGSLAGTAGMGVFYWNIVRPLPVIKSLQDYEPLVMTKILARDGTVIRTISRERRVVVDWEDVPKHVRDAFIASEDSNFYEHEGLDYSGIARAFWANLRAGGVVQGGSTITQQVAKTFLLTQDRTFVRKLKDMVLAKRIEESLEKNEILHLYLNQIYLGSGAYGIEAAANTYFDKSVSDLSIAEAAMIVGVVPAPQKFSPLRHPERAREKQLVVLGRMLKEGYIDQAQYDAARAETLVLNQNKPGEAFEASEYFVEEVRRYLVQKYGEDVVLEDGLTVLTTLDVEKQIAAWRAVRKGLVAHDHRSGYRGPIRAVPAAEWDTVLAELADQELPTDFTPGEPQLVKALVTEVDDAGKVVKLGLGGGREAKLTLKQISWAREPDREKDGAIVWVRKPSDALREGWLVYLERTPPSGDKPAGFELYQRPLAQGALMSLDVETGELDAMIGGYDFDGSQFNRAVQMKRQPGSAFKPIIYAEALERGYTPATIVYDTPMVFEGSEGVWKPENYSRAWAGPIILRTALAKSRNVPTIKILQDIGIQAVIDRAESLGITSKLEPNLALALGSSEITVAEMVKAYTTFAAGGRLIDPIFIREIRDRDGALLEENVLLQREPDAVAATPTDDNVVEIDPFSIVAEATAAQDLEEDPERLPPGYGLDPVTAYLMTDMLRAVVEEGTGRRVRALNRPIAGKTGTTNDLYDAWFIGFSPQTVTGVWVGYDTASNLGRNETGSRAASPIFIDYMREALRDEPVRDFAEPEGVEFAKVDPKTGLRSLDPKLPFLPFKAGTAPEEFRQNTIPTSSKRLD